MEIKLPSSLTGLVEIRPQLLFHPFLPQKSPRESARLPQTSSWGLNEEPAGKSTAPWEAEVPVLHILLEVSGSLWHGGDSFLKGKLDSFTRPAFIRA